ncbi:unnamed protein product, partial [Ectocarpus fasciculatus]
MSDLSGLKNWSKKQGYILTGGGVLEGLMLPGRDYEERDLPHYHLRQKSSEAVFAQWIRESRRHFGIVGAWSRPLFSGGWAESTDQDTVAFNLQTPSVFVDLRFPVDRPNSLSKLSSLEEYSLLELRKLGRQHCFAGYSLPETGHPADSPVFTRHHVIDWNFHPAFPRSRPNRWRVEVKEDKSCFKELSTALDPHGVPVYFERWARRDHDSMGEKYFAARRKCRIGSSESSDIVDAILVVVGDHFAVAIDRPDIEFANGEGRGGGPAWVDFLAEGGENCRKRLEAYLSLCGIYGRLNINTDKPWVVNKSTHPWLEGSPFLRPGSAKFSKTDEGSATVLHLDGFEWTVLENSFSESELGSIF